jgi:thioredoxin reductase
MTAWIPADLRTRGRAELTRHGVDVVSAEAQDAEVLDGVVRVSSTHGVDVTRSVLLATGMLDELPDLPGFAGVWGPAPTHARTAMASSTATNASPCWLYNRMGRLGLEPRSDGL